MANGKCDAAFIQFHAILNGIVCVRAVRNDDGWRAFYWNFYVGMGSCDGTCIYIYTLGIQKKNMQKERRKKEEVKSPPLSSWLTCIMYIFLVSAKFWFYTKWLKNENHILRMFQVANFSIAFGNGGRLFIYWFLEIVRFPNEYSVPNMNGFREMMKMLAVVRLAIRYGLCDELHNKFINSYHLRHRIEFQKVINELITKWNSVSDEFILEIQSVCHTFFKFTAFLFTKQTKRAKAVKIPIKFSSSLGGKKKKNAMHIWIGKTVLWSVMLSAKKKKKNIWNCQMESNDLKLDARQKGRNWENKF